MKGEGYIFAATQTNFPRLVLENSRKGLVLVDFWSPKAGPSLRQRDILSRLAREFQGRFLLVTVDTGEQRQLAAEYGVRSIPSCKLFRHGRVVEEVRGMQPEADYRKLVERHLAGPDDEVQVAALRAWQAGAHERALQLLAQGAMEQPDNLKLPLLMARLLVQAGRQADAHAVLDSVPPDVREKEPEIASLHAHLDFLVTAAAAPGQDELRTRIDADPGDSEARYRLASVQLVQDDYEGGMAQLIEIQRRDPDYRHGAARHGLLSLFRTLDPADERVKRYRAELFNLSH